MLETLRLGLWNFIWMLGVLLLMLPLSVPGGFFGRVFGLMLTHPVPLLQHLQLTLEILATYLTAGFVVLWDVLWEI